jgi:tetratricopeptide (TPR) repeat protein
MKEKRKNSQPKPLKWWLYILIIVTVAIGMWQVTPQQQVPSELIQSAETYSLRGYQFYLAGRYHEAIDNFTLAIELDSNSQTTMWAYNNRCYVYGLLAEYQSALQDCTRAIELDGHPYPYNNRCLAYNGLGEYDLAMTDCNHSISLDDSNSYAFKNRCLLYMNLGDYDLALEDCNHAVELDADFDLAYEARGLLYYNMGSEFYREAIADYERYARINGAFEPAMVAQIAEMQDILGDCASGLCYSVRD